MEVIRICPNCRKTVKVNMLYLLALLIGLPVVYFVSFR